MMTPTEAREKAILAHAELLGNWLRILCEAVNNDAMSKEDLAHLVEVIDPRRHRVERNIEILLRASGRPLEVIE